MMFERYFTLEEAAQMIPVIRRAFDRAHDELQVIQDEIVLYKRMFQVKEDEHGDEMSSGETQVLEQKCEAFESCFNQWHDYFAEQGIILRDMEEGLIDFPYKSIEGDVFLLCWKLEDDGLLYFHSVDSGFRGRQPISLLPE